jgi:hypothetical protein
VRLKGNGEQLILAIQREKILIPKVKVDVLGAFTTHSALNIYSILK